MAVVCSFLYKFPAFHLLDFFAENIQFNRKFLINVSKEVYQFFCF